MRTNMSLDELERNQRVQRGKQLILKRLHLDPTNIEYVQNSKQLIVHCVYLLMDRKYLTVLLEVYVVLVLSKTESVNVFIIYEILLHK